MSNQMCRVLYARYNSMRRPGYRITTEICENDSGIFVRKRAGEEAARAHLESIRENGAGLKDYYQGIEVIDSERVENGLVFPFIKGRTLAEQVDVGHFEKEAFIEQANRLLARVLSFQDRYVVPFESTAGFEAVFGRVELGAIPAVNPANIDSLLTNFIENDTGLYCIDYEWVCHFPVPVEFIKYRILLYLYVNQIHSFMNGTTLEEMLGWFGFSEQACEIYWQMDDRFQQYIHGEGRRFIYPERYKKKNATIEEVRQEILDLKTDLSTKEELISAKDVHIQNLEQQVSAKDVHIQNLEQQVSTKDVHIGNLEQQVSAKDVHIQNLEQLIIDKERHIRNQNNRIQELKLAYDTINAAFFWRITKPARVVLDRFKQAVSNNEAVFLFLKATKDTIRHGHKYAVERKREYLDSKRIQEEKLWPSREKLMKQRKEAFPVDATFSILVPLYNTPDDFLRQMIKSVQDQSYQKWELCLADGSDSEHGSVRKICLEAAHKDKRIRYKALERNMGISENTNACIGMASGNYIALFDHDDILHPSALYENMKVICSEGADFIYSDESTFHDEPSDAFWPHYKPDFAPDTLRSYNYICHLTVFKRTLLDEIDGCFRSQFDGSQDYDMVLRLTEKARRIVHIPKVLYYWRGHSGSVASDVGAKAYTVVAAKNALTEHLRRVGLSGKVLDSAVPSTYRIQYDIEGTPLISIVIPNMDHVDDLKKCIESISEISTWKNWEIIVVENNSNHPETFEYYRTIESDPRIRVVEWEGKFNFSAICNRGAQEARGDYILLLNNDIQVITPDWLEQMLMFAQRADVGAVGAMLYYPDNTIQHAGVIVGIGGVAGHSHKYFARGEYGYASRLTIAQDLSAVTAACCMIPTHVWKEINGLDESFAVAFNDVDLCMRIREAGYLIVWTPYAELYHFESKSRGLEDTPEKQKRFKSEIDRFQARWGKTLEAGDPYYNPNLTLEREDFSFR